METAYIIKALRCISTVSSPSPEKCDACPYNTIAILSPEEKAFFGGDNYTYCDCDKIGLDAADRMAKLSKKVGKQ